MRLHTKQGSCRTLRGSSAGELDGEKGNSETSIDNYGRGEIEKKCKTGCFFLRRRGRTRINLFYEVQYVNIDRIFFSKTQISLKPKGGEGLITLPSYRGDKRRMSTTGPHP